MFWNKYDGMIQDGLLRHVGNNVEVFANEIIDNSKRPMEAVVIWYTK